MASRNIKWTGDLDSNLREVRPKVRRAMITAAEYIAPQMEAHAKTNAPWTDRTGNARNGLKARASNNDRGVRVDLFHQVPYGVYLELRWSGRYAIIMPTIEKFAPQLARLIVKLAFE